MSDAATADRFRLIALLIIASVIALASYWLLQVTRQTSPDAARDEKRNEPDYRIENFHFVRIAESGKPHYIMSGTSLVHRPVTDRSDIDQASLLAFNPSQAPLTMHAKQAQLAHQSNQVQLLGDVNLVRAASGDSPGWHMQTEALLMLPDDDQMQTDQPVQIINGKTVLKGTGMFVDNTNGVFKLKSQVTGSFPPPDHSVKQTDKPVPPAKAAAGAGSVKKS